MIDGLGDQLVRLRDFGLGKALLATLATHINSVSVGMCQGYSAVLLPKLDDYPELRVTPEMKSWIASLGVITNPLGAILSGLLMEWLGRKTAVQLVAIPFLIGWLTIALSNNIFILCIGRAVTGVAIGMGAACYVYVAEISLPSQRGFLSAFGPIFVSLGVLLVYTLGALFNFKITAGACAVCALISACVVSLIPESPSWLLAHSKEKKARQALVWFRGDTDEAAQELADLSESHRAKTIEQEGSSNWEQFLRPSVWKPFLILIMFFVFQQGSGLYIILYYAVDIIRNSGSTIDEYVNCIIMALIRLITSIIGTLCIRRYNRRTMACVSGLCMAISMGVGGSYEYLYSGIEDVNLRPWAWIPQFCIMANVSASMLGMLQLPWIMVGELFPTAVRGVMSGVVSSMAYIFIFGVIKAYPQMDKLLGISGMMWTFAGISLSVIVYALLFLPETQGRTLIEIEAHFHGKKKCVDENKSNP